MPYSRDRLIPLEAFRGLAALIVLVHHFFLGFSPGVTGAAAESRHPGSLAGEPYFVFFNGGAAVTFFFTLSGFVLCWSYFKHENPDTLKLAFVKRWPRLAGIVTLTTVASWALFKLDLYRFTEAAGWSHSAWLARFASSGWTPGFEPSLVAAIFQGLSTFFTGQYSYNSNLWTMSPELFGSLVAFMLAAFLAQVLQYRLLAGAFILLAACCALLNPWLLPFVAGAFLSCWLARNPVRLPLVAAGALLLLALYLLGYLVPEKSYAWAARVSVSGKPYFASALHTAGSCAIILATLSQSAIYKRLDNVFFRLLGRLSFPLYLVHILVLCSVSSLVHARLCAAGVGLGVTLAATFAVTLLGSLAASWPLMKADEWWTGVVNRWARRVVLGAPATVPVMAPTH